MRGTAVPQVRSPVKPASRKHLARKTICFSKSVFMHDAMIGILVNRYEFGNSV